MSDTSESMTIVSEPAPSGSDSVEKSWLNSALQVCLALALSVIGLVVYALGYSPVVGGVIALSGLVAFFFATHELPFYKSAGLLIFSVLGIMAFLSILQALWTFGGHAF